MQRVPRWIAQRDVLLAVAAAAIGVAIAYVDSRPTWDDTGVTVSLILLTAAIVAGISGRWPWLWALLIGVWVPLFEIRGEAGAASLVALLVATLGAIAGFGLVRIGRSA
jgi:hypothetical protein